MHDEVCVERVALGDAAVWFADRRGGVSARPCDSLNVGEHVGDDAACVAENRRRLARAVAAGAPVPSDPDRWVWLRQVHGSTTLHVCDTSSNGRVADAVVTDTIGLPLVVQVADCVPVALVAGARAGAVHAGWKGLEAGVIASALDALRALDSRDAHEPRAWIGPCVMPCHYEFGPPELERLVRRFGASVEGRTLAGEPALDLPRAVEAALRECGVRDIEQSGQCTAHDPGRWFSHRRDGRTGRHAMVVARLP